MGYWLSGVASLTRRYIFVNGVPLAALAFKAAGKLRFGRITRELLLFGIRMYRIEGELILSSSSRSHPWVQLNFSQ